MKYDIAIIGGGPAGLMAASRASQSGAKTILIEKNKQPGLKLLITGGGRCNITNYADDYQSLAARLGKNNKFLLSALSKFGAREAVDFFESRGLKTKVEKNNRVFPASDKSQDVLRALTNYIINNGGKIKTGETVKSITAHGNQIKKIILADGQEIIANNYILATGGQSYPITGSTGDGYRWLKSLGHNITPTRPALVPIVIKEKFIKNLEGLSVSNIGLSLYKDNKKVISLTGDIIFTADSLSGPAALDLSRYLDRRLDNFKLELDFISGSSELELDKKLQTLFAAHGQKSLKNSLLDLLPPKLVPVVVGLIRMAPDKKVNSVSRAERQWLVKLLKHWPLTITAIGGYDKAMITGGGLDPKEVDPKTMRSKLIANLFIAGELLDIDGPTGGYNLQICWSTGYVAGESAASGISQSGR